jgi:hypothetical protein
MYLHLHTGGLEDIDRVLLAFATTCFNNSVACPLRNESASPFNFTHPEALLVAIDLTLDSLYRAPVPTSVGLPDATASHLRTLLFAKLYRPTSWPDLADFLVQAFNNNFINIVRATMVHVNEAQIETEDYPVFAPNVIVVRVLPHSVVHVISAIFSVQTQSHMTTRFSNRRAMSLPSSYFRAFNSRPLVWGIDSSTELCAMPGIALDSFHVRADMVEILGYRTILWYNLC